MKILAPATIYKFCPKKINLLSMNISLYRIKMASLVFIVWAIAVAVLKAALANHLNRKFEGSIKKDLELEILKKLEIERIKSKILKDLGMEEPPTFPNSSCHLSNDVIQMIVENSDPKPPIQRQHNLASLMIFPINRDFQCQYYNDSSCRRFEFRISPDVVPSPSEFWVHKLKSYNSENLTVSVLCSHPKQQEQKVFEHEKFLCESDTTKWLFFQLPKFKDLEFWQGNVVCSVEISGTVIDDHERNLPFLKMTKDTEARIRKKKTEGSTRNIYCKSVPFNVSFADIGFGDWIIYPESYTANICKGYCQHTQNHHETFMHLLYQKNKTLEEQYGSCWLTCCRPREYDALRMIYREKDNRIAYKNMTNMVVVSCSCS